jgi:predicted MPP superfamily phosphohydrolase
MKQPTLAVLHLSDSHIRAGSDWTTKAEKIAHAIRAKLNISNSLLIAFTGDIAWSGGAEEYEVAERFLSDLKSRIADYFSNDINIVCVPGNHDCNFSGPQGVRKELIDSVRKKPGMPINDSVMAECCKVLENFDNFARSIESPRSVVNDLLWSNYTFSVGNKSVCVQAVNTAWSCEKRTDPSNIPFPVHRARPSVNKDVAIKILLTHLPNHWIQQETYRDFRTLIRRESDLVLTGHEHMLNSGATDDTDSGSTAFVEGGALAPHEHLQESTFSLILLELQPAPLKANFYHYHWASDCYLSTSDGQPEKTIEIKPKLNSGIQFSSSALEFYSDLGASITHPAKAKVELRDLFVFPDLENDNAIDDGETDASSVVESQKLLQSHTSGPLYSLVKGEQASGKTSLLKAVALQAIEMGLVPVFLHGKDITRSAVRELQQLIEKSIREQYQQSCHVEVLQAPKARVVLLIDNLDRYGFPPKYFADAIDFFTGVSGQLIATVDHLFDFNEALLADSLSSLRDFRQLGILPLSVKCRYALIKSWFSVNSDVSRAEGQQRLQNTELASKHISSVLSKGLVPKYPIYVMILLQGIETGHSNQLENSALGQYYEYLILHALSPVISKDSLKEALNYCEQFAWYLHSTHQDRLRDTELRQFHSQFERTHDVEIDFEKRKKTLIQGKIWMDVQGHICFRYQYTYFFFLGRYLARNFGEQEVRALADSYAESLHVRDHGNTMLFLAHHGNNEEVFEMLVRAIGNRFVRQSPLRLDKDLAQLDHLVAYAPQMAYSEDQAEKKRHEIVEQDETVTENLENADRISSDDAADPDNAAINLIADLNALFKGIEILGMALKAGYGDLKAEQKQKYLVSIMDGGLRGLTGFIEVLGELPEYFVPLIDEKLLSKTGMLAERRSQIAKKVVFTVIASLVLGFVRKVGSSIGSRNLHPAIKRLVAENNTSSYRLIEIAALLETPGPIPIEVLETLTTELANNSFALSVLRRLALTRVYLYETPLLEKQKLFSILGIRIDAQIAIDMKTKHTKKARINKQS